MDRLVPVMDRGDHRNLVLITRAIAVLETLLVTRCAKLKVVFAKGLIPVLLVPMKRSEKNGFTLIELLITIAILGILATVGFGQFKTSQKKARDAQRKADLGNIARALEMYYNDHQSYPLTLSGWGLPFEDENNIYMKKLPEDPGVNWSYCYFSGDEGSSFALFTKLENERDSDYRNSCTDKGSECYLCNNGGYDYVISSSNYQVGCATCP